MRSLPLAALAAALIVGACSQEPTTPVTGTGDPNRGRQVYLAQCVACHNPEPSQTGPIGPAVKGSSLELLEARVVHGAYPPGYKPKRDSALMQPMPHLASALPDLAAYLK